MKTFSPVTWLVFALLGTPAMAYDVEVLRQSGAAHQRIDLVILGDGYRAEDQAQLTTDARNLLNSLFGFAPYKEYAGLFNAKLVHVTSAQNGADRGIHGDARDTALHASYFCSDIERLLCVDNTVATTIAAQHVPEYEFILVLVNDTRERPQHGVCPRRHFHPIGLPSPSRRRIRRAHRPALRRAARQVLRGQLDPHNRLGSSHGVRQPCRLAVYAEAASVVSAIRSASPHQL